MRVLLMSMPDIFPFSRPWKMLAPSLALSSIAGNLDERHTVGIADLVLKRKDVKRAVVEALERTRPEVVGITAMTFQYDTAIKIARLIKNTDPKIKIVIGGYHATLMYKDIADREDSKCLDFMVRGEGDLIFNELLDKLESGGPLNSVNGLSYKDNEIFVHNKARELEELNSIKLPNRKVRIWKGYHFFGSPYDMIESSRGCTLGCSFCSIRQMYGRSFRKYDISRVLEDIERAKEAGVHTLFFTDDNITLDINRFEELADRIIERRHNDLTYVIQASSAGISSSLKLVKKMSEAGFRFVFLGIENISKKNLSALKKGDIAEKSVKAIKMLLDNDIIVIGGLIIGNPDDDHESIEENYRFVNSTGVSSIYDQILTPYLKTEIREELLQQGLVTNTDNYKLYNGQFANVRTKHLSDMDLDFIKFKMVQKYSPSLLGGIVRKHRLLIKNYTKFTLKLLPFAVKSFLSIKIKNFYKNENQLFIDDYKRCINENVFNVPM